MPHRQLTTYQAVILQARAYRTVRTFMVETLRNYGLTLTEWLMIGVVVDTNRDGARISDLAEVLGVELPVITNLVKRAELTGWVTRTTDTTDKRAKRIISTMEGREKACDIEGELQTATGTWLKDLDVSMLDGYLTTVGTLAVKEVPSEAIVK